MELIWLTGRLSPDFKTIADFRKDNGAAIRSVCREFVVLCRNLNLFSDALVAIDGSKFKAVNGRDRNFTKHKLKARMQQLEENAGRPNNSAVSSTARYSTGAVSCPSPHLEVAVCAAP